MIQRQIDNKDRAGRVFATDGQGVKKAFRSGRFHPDDPAVVFDDAKRHGKPQARSLAHGLGGEKGIEDAALVFGADARSGVGTLNHQTEI